MQSEDYKIAPATAAAQHQNISPRSLNSEEPQTPPHPQSQPRIVLHAFDCGVGPAEQVGLAWLKYSGLPAYSHWRQSQEHCCPGSIARTAAAEDGGAAGPLCEVYIHVSTATETSTGTWETARAQTRGAEFRGFMHKMPKALHGRAATP